jgi:hypothetical protein
MIREEGFVARWERRKAGALMASAGKSFTCVAPERSASAISVGVKAPGSQSTPAAAHVLPVAGSVIGETTIRAPASQAR